MTDIVEYVREGHIGYVTLNRPEQLNALNIEVFEATSAILSQIEHDPMARVCIVRGAGRAFCAGMDMGSTGQGKYIHETSPWAERDRLRQQMDFWTQYWRSPKPTVLQAHGFCMGGGIMFLILSDFVVMSEECAIGGARLPLGGGFIGPLIGHLFGTRRAKEIDLLIGNRLTAEIARQWGLVTQVVPRSDLASAAGDLARRIARAPQSIIALRKAAINAALERSGFLETMQACAEWDSLAHVDPSVAEARRLIDEHGIRGAIALFESDAELF